MTFGYDGNSAKIVSITPFFDTPAPGVPIKLIGTYPSPSVQCDARERMFFAAHGMGIVPHDAPWLTSGAFPSYPAHHRDRPLGPGMVISI